METTQHRSENRKQLSRQIGSTVKVLLKARGMTARQLGEHIGEPETTMSKLINGRQAWQVEYLRDTADALDVDIPALFEEPYDALRLIGLSRDAAATLVGNMGKRAAAAITDARRAA